LVFILSILVFILWSISRSILVFKAKNLN
jgi:hypothetical protein